MSDGISLGAATLDLDADLAPLRADLERAKAEVAVAAAEMQKLLDRHVDVSGKKFATLGSMIGSGLQAPLAQSKASLAGWATAQEAALAKVRSSLGDTSAAYMEMADTAEAAADLQVAASGRVVEAYGAQAAAAKAAADSQEAAAARSAAARDILGGVGSDRGAMAGGSTYRLFTAGRQGATEVATGSSGIWGVRGPTPPPGSIANPIVVALEAASRTPLGSLAAAVGEDSSGSDTTVVGNEKGGRGTILAATPSSQQGPAAPSRGPVVAVGPEGRPEKPAEDALALAKAALQGAMDRSGPDVAVAKAREGGGSPAADAVMADLLSKRLGPGQVAKTAPGYRQGYEALGYTVASRAAGGPARLYAPGGQPGTSNYGLSQEAALLAEQRAAEAREPQALAAALTAALGRPYGAGAMGVPGLGLRSGGNALGPDITKQSLALGEDTQIAKALAPSDGGGGGFPPWLMGALWGHAGGGGGGGYSGAGTGLLGHALFGAAGFGAGMGSLGSFAGFGPEHIVLTIGGIAGSGVAALGGGSLLAGGALGKVGVGMGSDVAVASSAIADTGSLYKNYEKLREAVAQYGKASTQAKEAQAELTENMKYTLSGTKGVTAELGLAEKVSALNVAWDKGTSGARVQFVGLAEQAVKLGSVYLPLVAKAAEQNFAATSKAIKPLFSWIEGPEGIGIFEKLESEFHEQIPTAMKALDMGFQFLGKTIAAVAPLTGGLLSEMDRFFTRMDEPQNFAKWEEMMSHMIKDFHTWGAFIKELGGALVDLFDKDAHTGEGIIETLTKMLHGVREWEKSVTGSSELKTIFTVHKEEVIALLKALSELVAPFEEIYMTLSPPLVKAVTTVTESVAKMLLAFESLGSGATWVVGIGLILGKLKLLVPLLTQAGAATGLLANEVSGATKISDLTVAQGQKLGVVPVASKGAAAEGAAVEGGVAEEGLTGAVLTDAMASAKSSLSAALPDLIKGGLVGLGTSMVASALGVHGTTNTALSSGLGVGVAGSMALGPEVGIPAGLATAGLIEAVHALNKKAPEEGTAFAKAFFSGFSTVQPKTVLEPKEGEVATRRNEIQKLMTPKPAFSAAPGGLISKADTTVMEALGIVEPPKPSAAALKKAKSEWAIMGREQVSAFTLGEKEAPSPTQFDFVLGAKKTLDKMKPEARMSGALAILELARGMEESKKLPVGALAQIRQQLENTYKHLGAYLKEQGKGTSGLIAASLNLEKTKQGLATSLTEISKQFGGIPLGYTEALAVLKVDEQHSTGEKLARLRRQSAELEVAHGEVIAAEVAKTKAGQQAQLGLLEHFGDEMKALGPRVWQPYTEAVEAAMNSGALAMTTGLEDINRLLEKESSEVGLHTHISVGKSGNLTFTTPKKLESGLGTVGPGAAAGGLLQIGQPGEAGRDTVGLNVGGLPIAVAPGEQVAVFNRHQLPIVNAALAPMGGLPGLFSQVSTPNYMASGGIVAPHVSGAGAIPDVVRGGLSLVAKAANAKAGKASAASAAGAGPAGGGPPASSNEALGRRMMLAAGFPGSEWGYLQKLWTRESGWRTTAKNPTSPAYGIPQSDPGDKMASAGADWLTNPATQIKWGLGYIKSTYGTIAAAWAQEMASASDPGGGGYGLGGLLSFATGGLLGFAGGGLPSVASSHAQKTTRGLPKKAKGLGKNKKPTGLFKPVPGLKKALPDVYQQQLKELASIMERQVPQLEEEYGDANEEDTQELAKAPHAGEFIITPTATEKLAGITLPWEDKPNVELRLSQLTGLEGYWTSIHEHLNSALEMTNPVTAGTIKAIQERKKKIEEIRAKIKELRKKLAAKLKAIRDKITANIKEITVHEHALTALGNPTKANNAARAHLKAEINKLKGENKNLGGDETEVGTGGEIGSRTKKAETEITTLQTNSAALVSQQKELEERHTMLRGDVTTIAGQSGHGGSLEQALLKHGEIAQQITELGGTPQKLKEALLEAGGGPESALELAEREKAQAEEKNKLLGEELKVSNTALSVFGGSGDIGFGGKNAFLAAMAGGGLVPLPYGGSFAAGGTVPGPIGAPIAVVAHGGEEYLGVGQQREPSVVIHQKNEMMHPSDPDVLMGVGKATVRGMRLQGYRQSKRINPGI